jgi:hypothetical protein
MPLTPEQPYSCMLALMARELLWRRGNVEYAQGAAYSNGFVIQGAFVDEGETLTKTWLTWYAQHVSEGKAHGVGMGVALGVIMGENGWTAADVPNPWDNPNADWLWYEPGYFMPVLLSDQSGVTDEMDVYPLDNSVKREIRSQRKGPAGGGNVWFTTSTSTLSPLQSRHYLCLSYSCGVLVAP